MEAQPEGKLNRLLTVEEAAEHLPLRPATVRGWLRTGLLKGSKLGRVWRISEIDLSRISEGSNPTSNTIGTPKS